MSAGIQIDIIGLNRAVRDLQKTGTGIGLTVQWMVWDTARLAGNDLVKYTAPWAGENSLGTFGQQKKTGQGAVAHDIGALFDSVDKNRYIYFTNQTTGKSYYREVGSRVVYEVPQEITASEIPTIHVASRNRRGRVKSRHVALVKARAVKRYIKSVQAKVGELKAGWVPALTKFGSLTHGKVTIPAWVRKQSASGGFLNTVTRGGNGSVVLHNTAHHSRAIREGTVLFIEHKRNQDINNGMRKRMRTIAKRFERGQAQARAVTS